MLWSISDPKLFYLSLGTTTVAEQRLDALKKSLTGTEKTVILDQDSELAQILAGN